MKRVLVAAALVAAVLPAAANGGAPAAPAARDARPAAAAAARAAAWAERYRVLAARVPALRPLADAVVAAAAAVPATETSDFAIPVEWGDFDGDGGRDVADLRFHESFDDTTGDYSLTVRVEAYRGRDGRLLWTAPLPGNDPLVFPTRLAGGRAGMVVFSDNGAGADALVGGGAVGDVLVTAFDGAGRKTWTHTVPLAEGGALVGGLGTGMYLGGVGDLDAGGGDDVLVEEHAGTGAGDPVSGETLVSRGRIQLRVLNGATGAARDLGAAFLSDDILFPAVVGDVSGDRRPDVALVVGSPGVRTLRALRSSDGAEVWASAIKPGTEPYVVGLPDMSGDGRAEVGLHEFSYEDGTETFAAFDGATGRMLWRQESGDVVPLGDVDGRRGAEVALLRTVRGGSSIGIRVTAVTASGRTVWSATRTVSTAGLKEPRVSTSTGDAGDVQPDGVRDIGYAITALPLGAAGRRDEGTIDGRTGRVRRDPAPEMRGTTDTIDGRGSDSYERVVARGVLTVTAWRGDRPERLWRSAVRAGASGDALGGSFAGPLDRDRCAEVVVTLRGARTTTVVLSGATGAPLWVLTRSGDARGVVSRPKALATRRYARTC